MPKGKEREPNELATLDRGHVLAKAQALDPKIIESLVTNGDMSRLTPNQVVDYYNYRCHQAGLDPSAKPFDKLKLNGKEILYANATATQQLCKIHQLTTQVVSRETVEGVYVVCIRVSSPDGRSSDNMGAVPIKGLAGDGMANAMMKATTKAIRRTVLAHCGLGMLDETEVDTIPNVVRNIQAPAWEEEQIQEANSICDLIQKAALDKYKNPDLARRGADKYRDQIGKPSFLEWMAQAEEAMRKLIPEDVVEVVAEEAHPETIAQEPESEPVAPPEKPEPRKRNLKPVTLADYGYDDNPA